jgi:hypothetical protein
LHPHFSILHYNYRDSARSRLLIALNYCIVGCGLVQVYMDKPLKYDDVGLLHRWCKEAKMSISVYFREVPHA